MKDNTIVMTFLLSWKKTSLTLNTTIVWCLLKCITSFSTPVVSTFTACNATWPNVWQCLQLGFWCSSFLSSKKWQVSMFSSKKSKKIILIWKRCFYSALYQLEDLFFCREILFYPKNFIFSLFRFADVSYGTSSPFVHLVQRVTYFVNKKSGFQLKSLESSLKPWKAHKNRGGIAQNFLAPARAIARAD